MGVRARHLVVHGNVQGVFFRDSTRQHARERGVTGWVRNRDDGAVEVHLEGDDSAVARVESWIAGGGPSQASVEHVDADDAEVERHDGFRVVG